MDFFFRRKLNLWLLPGCLCLLGELQICKPGKLRVCSRENQKFLAWLAAAGDFLGRVVDFFFRRKLNSWPLPSCLCLFGEVKLCKPRSPCQAACVCSGKFKSASLGSLGFAVGKIKSFLVCLAAAEQFLVATARLSVPVRGN